MLKIINKIKYFLLLYLIILVDFFSKYWVSNNIKLNTSVFLNHFINITHIKNNGVAFGLLSNLNHNLYKYILISIIICTIIILILLTLLNKKRNNFQIPYYFITGGAIGNLLDRILNNEVTDFIDVHIGKLHFPIFNIADTAIFLASLFIIIKSVPIKKK